MTYAWLPPVLTLLACLVASPGSASEFLERRVTVDDGLVNNWITALAQDERGALWAAGPGGLVRWDGTTTRVFGHGHIGHEPIRVTVGGGRVVVVEGHKVAFELVDDQVEPLTDAAGEPLHVRDAWLDDGGVLYVLTRDRIVRNERRGAPLDEVLSGPPAEDLRRLDAGLGPGQLLLGGKGGWWTWTPGGSPERLVEGTSGRQALVEEDGTLWVLDWFPATIRRRSPDGTWRTMWAPDGVGWARGFTVADGVLWTGYDGTVQAVHPDGRTEHFGDRPGAVSPRGPWLVDREGSVWSGGYSGLVQIPEPELRVWGAQSGLPSETVRDVLVREHDVLVSTWDGAARLERGAERAEALPGPKIKGSLCLDGDGVAWGRGEREDGRIADVAIPADGVPVITDSAGRTAFRYACESVEDEVWLVESGEVHAARGVDRPARSLIDLDLPLAATLEVGPERAWIGARSAVCQVERTADGSLGALGACHDTGSTLHLMDLHRTPAGSVWAASKDRGVLVWTDDGFVPHPSSDALPTRTIHKLVDSPRGGTWIVGSMPPVRVVDRPTHPDGWELVERLPGWLGGTFSAVKDIAEEPDGTLWLSTQIGVVRLPGRARDAVPDAPGVYLSQVRLDGDRLDTLPVDAPLELGSESRLELRLGSDTLRDRSEVRFRTRLDGGAWSPPSDSPTWMFTGFDPGHHRIEVAASADGEHWTPRPAVLMLDATGPWWQSPWLWLGMLGLASVGALGVQQLRASWVQREARLRQQVAMDLHDEVGAGLASIGLLAGLASQHADRKGSSLARRIAEDAEELGASVSGLVWSLRQRRATPDALVELIESRARSLLPHLDASADLHLRVAPDVDGLGELDLDVLRALQLIVLEALHNVARHAAATEVIVSIGRHPRRGWLRIEVIDDGIGFDPDDVRTAPDHGLGLSSMASRARAVGGRATLSSEPGAGTTVTVEVPVRRSRFWTRT